MCEESRFTMATRSWTTKCSSLSWWSGKSRTGKQSSTSLRWRRSTPTPTSKTKTCTTSSWPCLISVALPRIPTRISTPTMKIKYPFQRKLIAAVLPGWRVRYRPILKAGTTHCRQILSHIMSFLNRQFSLAKQWEVHLLPKPKANLTWFHQIMKIQIETPCSYLTSTLAASIFKVWKLLKTKMKMHRLVSFHSGLNSNRIRCWHLITYHKMLATYSAFRNNNQSLPWILSYRLIRLWRTNLKAAIIPSQLQIRPFLTN